MAWIVVFGHGLSENEIRIVCRHGSIPIEWCRMSNVSYLFLVLLPDLEHLFVGKADSIHALKGIIVGVSQPICGGMASGGKCLDLSCVCNMRSATQVNQVSAFVDGGTRSIGHLGVQYGHLERIISKEFQRFFLGDYHALKLLLGLDNLVDLGFDRFVCRSQWQQYKLDTS